MPTRQVIKYVIAERSSAGKKRWLTKQPRRLLTKRRDCFAAQSAHNPQWHVF